MNECCPILGLLHATLERMLFNCEERYIKERQYGLSVLCERFVYICFDHSWWDQTCYQFVNMYIICCDIVVFCSVQNILHLWYASANKTVNRTDTLLGWLVFYSSRLIPCKYIIHQFICPVLNWLLRWNQHYWKTSPISRPKCVIKSGRLISK